MYYCRCMSDNSDPGPVLRVLSPEQESKALALFRDLLGLRDQGIKFVLVHNEEVLGLRAVGQRRGLTGLTLA